MNLIMPCIEAHPDSGKEVMVMDDVDVDVCGVSINYTSVSHTNRGKTPC